LGQSNGGRQKGARVLPYVLISMVFGVVTEVSARVLKLWVYRQPQTPVLNVIVVFGLVMGSVATLVPRHGRLVAFAIAFALGLAYEIANLAFLKWWDFPDERIGFIRGHAALVLVISALWGGLPVLTATVHAALPRVPHFAEPRQSAIEKLNEREKMLIDKLDATREREHDLESRLEDVRQRKQLVLEKEAGHKVERPRSGPTLTP
jgi:hypothetical protein